MDINVKNSASILATTVMECLAISGVGDILQYRSDDIGRHEAIGHVVVSGDADGVLQLHGGGASLAISSFKDGSIAIILIDADTNCLIEDIKHHSLAANLDAFNDVWGVAKLVCRFREYSARRLDELAEAEQAEQVA